MKGADLILYLVAGVLAATILAIDLHVPTGVAVGAMYCMVLLYSWLLYGRYATLAVALTCTVLVIGAMIFSEHTAAGTALYGINRIISIIVIWVCAFLVIIAKRSVDELEQSKASLEGKVRARTQELRKNEEKLRLMINEIEGYAIIMLNEDGIVESWNKGARRIKGFTKREIVGKNFRVFYLPEDQEARKPERLINKARRHGMVFDEGWRVRSDGTKYWGSVTISAIHDESSRLIGFTKIVRDLTERKAYEDTLLQQSNEMAVKNRELEQFAYIASHDLQEPLQTVISFTSLLNEECAHLLNQRNRQGLQYILQATQRMSQLIRGLLAYSQIGRGAEPERVHVQEIMGEVVCDLYTCIQKTSATVEYANLPTVCGYAYEVRQLFQNLISNALKFKKKDQAPFVRITAVDQTDEVQFSVYDNGIGIPKEHHQRIFTIFQRLHRHKEYEGTGIGLAQCQKIVHLHGGKIWVESEPGFGSIFHFTLPSKGGNIPTTIVQEQKSDVVVGRPVAG